MDNEAASTGLSESFILGLIASVGGLVSMVFAAMRKSRCENIKCCCGMFSCQRDVLTHEEIVADAQSPKINSHNNV